MADDDTPDDKTDPKPDPDAGAKKALEAERKARREADAKAKDLEAQLAKIQDEGKSASDKLTEQVAQLTKNLADESVKRLRVEVAAARGLTPAQAKRLTGTTQEELEADADDLLEAFPAPPAKDETKDDKSGDDKGTDEAKKKPAPNDMQGKDSTGSGADVKSLIESIPPTA